MSVRPDITVAITCHAEGILLHKTLLAVAQSIEHALETKPSLSFQVFVHADNATPQTTDYLKRLSIHFPSYDIVNNTFGDPGKARNECLRIAKGKYVSFIDGDDLMSQNWLLEAYTALESEQYGDFVAHSDMTVEFGALTAVVQKYGALTKPEDTLLSVWSGRWNSILMGPTTRFQQLSYPTNSAGYGFEDWLFSCDLIHEGVTNITIPKTAMFVRRKEEDSVWDTHRRDMAVLPANPLLSFDNIRALTSVGGQPHKATSHRSAAHRIKTKVSDRLQGSPLHSPFRKIYRYLSAKAPTQKSGPLPAWLIAEWQRLHAVDKTLFPSQDLLSGLTLHQSITPIHYEVGRCYKQLIDSTKHNDYDYILFVPWLTRGGADLFAINYANEIARYNPKKNVLVMATLPVASEWQSKLDKTIDFIEFGVIVSELDNSHKMRLLEQFIENSHAAHLHILNSDLAYEFVRLHKKYIVGSGKKIIATSFSQSQDNSGRVFGYSHTHVPRIYDQLALVASDNTAVLDMWQKEYGFDEKKLRLHHQPIVVANARHQQHTQKASLNILWAARLAPEKLVELVGRIGSLLESEQITIDMYGTPDEGYDMSFVSHLPSNVIYKGAFDGFASLPTESYDAYLYTSLFDGMPNALFDATLVGLPIVASSVGGVPEFIDDERGLLVTDIYSEADYF